MNSFVFSFGRTWVFYFIVEYLIIVCPHQLLFQDPPSFKLPDGYTNGSKQQEPPRHIATAGSFQVLLHPGPAGG